MLRQLRRWDVCEQHQVPIFGLVAHKHIAMKTSEVNPVHAGQLVIDQASVQQD